MEMSDRVVVVAGGTGALGGQVSLAFLAAGARVVATARRAEDLAPLTAAAGPNARRLRAASVDVTIEAEVQAFIADVAASEGRIDALVNAVGGYAGGANLWETEPALLTRMLALNLTPGFLLARAVVPVMRAAGSGAIVNVASRAGFGHAPGAAAYAASKAAALALIDSLADELKGSGITVNSVVPSLFDTPANRAAMPGADFARWPRPEEIARVILFLCTPAARVIHGAAIPVYGAT